MKLQNIFRSSLVDVGLSVNIIVENLSNNFVANLLKYFLWLQELLLNGGTVVAPMKPFSQQMGVSDKYADAARMAM